MHQQPSMVNMGIRARPAPRMTAETLWAKASAQKKKHSVRICETPMATTAGSLLKTESRVFPKNSIAVIATASAATPSAMHSASVFLHRRLKKIIGQVQTINRMVDEDIPCKDVLAQINAARSALNGCGKVVLEGHIRHCVRDGIQHGDAEKTIESFTKAVERFANMQ